MALTITLIVSGIALVYLGWFLHVSMYAKLRSLGIDHDYSYLNYFDSILKSSIFGLIVARIGWIVVNFQNTITSGFSFLPYERVGVSFLWFTAYPWKFFLFSEGLLYYMFWGAFALGILVFITIPSIRLINSLKIDKFSVKASLGAKELAFFGIVTALCVFIALLSLNIF